MSDADLFPVAAPALPDAGPEAPAAPAPDADFREYLAVREQIELLQARLDVLKPSIVQALAVQGGKAVYGRFEFCVRNRVTYAYSEAVEEAERRCRELKRQEEQNGTATVKSYSEFPYVRGI
jgi:hypothetical protein